MSRSRFQTKYILLVLASQLTAFVVGCNHNAANDEAQCTEGDTTRCTGTNDCGGERTCDDSGEYGSCVCAKTEGSTGTDTGTSTTTDPVPLGTGCNGDSACPEGATCLMPNVTSWLGGAPTEGICVADCSLDETVCEDFADAICMKSDRPGSEAIAGSVGSALCLPSCSPDGGSLDAPACEATPGTLCEPLTDDGSGFCRPVCSFDEQCASSHCDRQFGVCVPKSTTREVSFGAACEPEATTCNGVCLSLSSGYSFCSNRCQFGSREDCNLPDAEQLSSVCAFAAPGAGLGDVGYCAELCDCDDDCSHNDFVCEAFPTATLQTSLGHVGICTAPVDSVGDTHTGIACVL